MLTVLATVAVVSGVKLILSWADRSASCPFASTYSDSLVANRVRLAAIDRLLARYDLSQADRIFFVLGGKRKASAAELMEFDLARIRRNAFEDSLPENAGRMPEEAPPTYSIENPFTQRARLARSVEALKHLGADAADVASFLEYEGLTPVGDSAQSGGGTSPVHAKGAFHAASGPDAQHLFETGQGDSALKTYPALEWYNTLLIARRLAGYRAECAEYRRELAIWLSILLGALMSLVVGWRWRST